MAGIRDSDGFLLYITMNIRTTQHEILHVVILRPNLIRKAIKGHVLNFDAEVISSVYE